MYQHQLTRRMQEVARNPRPSIRGTPEAKERGRRAAIARWNRRFKSQNGDPDAATE
jgi:hypothetical protein